MTHPTKAIVGMLLRDFIAVSRGGVDEGLYTAADLQASLARTEVIDFHQTLDIDGIKVPIPADTCSSHLHNGCCMAIARVSQTQKLYAQLAR